jgi:23S rRNA pseudouridine955/2504/2580 synthase
MTGVQMREVSADEADIRLDRWFKRHFPALGHGRLEKLMRTGQVRVDGKRAKASTRVLPGQTIRVPPLESADAAQRPRPSDGSAVREADVASLKRAILYMDDDVIALNKSPGLAVQGGSKVSVHVDAMLDGLRFGNAERPRLVHRLDKDTSGVLLLGRSAYAAAALTEAFRGRDARKTYWALVAGTPKPKSGRIDMPLIKGPGRGGREMMAVDETDGRRAVTRYVVLESAGGRVSWMALRPETGRTHQLRIHCREIGTPIVGDGKYGGAAAMISGLPSGRALLLHARSIVLPHPRGGTLSVAAELPDNFRKTWDFFGFSEAVSEDPFGDGITPSTGRIAM